MITLVLGAAIVILLVALTARWAMAIDAAVYVTVALMLTVFSGHSGDLGLPLGPDRLVLAFGCGLLVIQYRRKTRRPALRWTPAHWLLVILTGLATFSAFTAGTLFTSEGFYALLDRLGIVPMLLFVLAPILFRTEQQRRVLLVGLVALGAYLGFTALCEGFGVRALVFPRYINNPAIGLHYDRARGPFTEAVANGLALYACAVAAFIGAFTWRRRRWALVLCAGIGVVCLLGTLLTLTRAVWLGTVVATLATMALAPRLRRYVAPAAVLGVVGVLAVLLLVPSLASQASERAADQRPLWDRQNANATALRIVNEKPLTGIGWQRFVSDNAEYTRQADTYPITTTEIEVHNVFLSRAAELGLPGLLIYLAALAATVGRAMFSRPRTRELEVWRYGLFAVGVSWFLAANFGPLSYAFPNALLWLLAGVVLTPDMINDEPDEPESDESRVPIAAPEAATG